MKQMTSHGSLNSWNERIYPLLVRVQTGMVTMEMSAEVSPKAENQSTTSSALTILGRYPKDSPSHYRDNCSCMFIAALSIIARNWKQPGRPSTDEWIMKMWYIYTAERYSFVKKNQIMTFEGKWMELEKKNHHD